MPDIPCAAKERLALQNRGVNSVDRGHADEEDVEADQHGAESDHVGIELGREMPHRRHGERARPRLTFLFLQNLRLPTSVA